MQEVEPKSYNFSKGERPKVLLLGNGLNRAYNGPSWDALLDLLKESEYTHAAAEYSMPMPLKAIMLSGNHLFRKLKVENGTAEEQRLIKKFYDDAMKPISDEQKEMTRKLLDLDFDYILTTNYSYEVEASAKNRNSLTKDELKQTQRIISDGKQKYGKMVTRYHSCVDGEDKETQVWHIHGELDLPGSMILGHMYYGDLLKKCIEVYDKRRDEYTRHMRNGQSHQVSSWVEAFLWGDVYIVGFGMGLSEIDLWWLLEKKADRQSGTVTFYEPQPGQHTVCPLDWKKTCDVPKDFVDENQCKLQLMRVFGAVTKDLGVTAETNEDYKRFYGKACEDLKSTIG